MKKKLLQGALLCLAMGLSACQGMGSIGTPGTPGAPASGPTPLVLSATEYVCVSATAALKTAIFYNGKLTVAQRSSVDKAVAVINPTCSQMNVPNLTGAAFAALQGAGSQLVSIAALLQP